MAGEAEERGRGLGPEETEVAWGIRASYEERGSAVKEKHR